MLFQWRISTPVLKLTPGSSGLRCGDHWLPSSHRGVARKARSEDGDWSAHQWPWRDDLPPLLLQPERDQPGAPEYPWLRVQHVQLGWVPRNSNWQGSRSGASVGYRCTGERGVLTRGLQVRISTWSNFSNCTNLFICKTRNGSGCCSFLIWNICPRKCMLCFLSS